MLDRTWIFETIQQEDVGSGCTFGFDLAGFLYGIDYRLYDVVFFMGSYWTDRS